MEEILFHKIDMEIYYFSEKKTSDIIRLILESLVTLIKPSLRQLWN